MTPSHLTPEEAFLWLCARSWRQSSQLAASTQQYWPDLDWNRVLDIVRKNKMQTLLFTTLKGTGCFDELPTKIQGTLSEEAEKLVRLAEEYAVPLADYLERAAVAKVPTVVLKGLSISNNYYQNPAMRPGGDIDLLVRKQDLHASLEILDRMGNHRWHKLLDDRYYERHHLHQIRGRLDTRIWFEVHWALDHPYTLLTIDYDGMLNRAVPGTLLNQPVYELTPPDQLLSQVVHLVKHAIYLPATIERPDMAGIILADGMLMYFLDVAETVRHYEDALDWPETIRLAREWGTADMLGAVLRVCHQYLKAPVPSDVLAQLKVKKANRVNDYVMNRLVEFEVARQMGQTPSRLWAFLVGYQESFVLRPIRLLDAMTYFFPSAEFLRRRYGRSGFLTRIQHALKATGQYLHNLLDSIYFTWDYHHRLKKEDMARGFIEPQQGSYQ